MTRGGIWCEERLLWGRVVPGVLLRGWLPILFLLGCHPDAGVRPDEGPPDLPRLQVDWPPRASFQPSELRVSGKVTAGDGALVSLVVNDEAVPFGADGEFEAEPYAEPGIAIIGVRVEDDLGERAVDGRAVQVGPTRAPGLVIEDAIALQLGPEALDDDEADLDDFASIFEAVVEDPSFSQAIVGTTTTTSYYTLVITGFELDHATVDLAPTWGSLDLTTTIHGMEATFDADLVDLFPVSGSAWADRAILAMDLQISTTAGEVQVVPVGTTATLEGFGWECEWVPSWLEGLLEDSVRAQMEAELEAKAQEMIGTLMSEALEGFATDTTFGDRDQVRLSMEVSSAQVVPEGLLLWLDASVQAATLGVELPPHAGSLRTSDAPPALPIPTSQPFACAIDDDFLNQALFSFWSAGDLGAITMSGAELALMSGQALPPPLGPAREARLDVMLPPVVMPPTGELGLDLAIGELWMAIEREDGVTIAVSLNVRAPADLVGTEDGLSMVIDDRPAFIEVQAGMLESPPGLDPGDLASLFRLSTPGLLGQSSSLFPSFPAPEIPVGEMMDVDALSGVVMELEDVAATMDEGRWIVVTGRLAEGG